MTSKKHPQIYIIAGPNGSGKTTFVERFLPYYVDCLHFVNADLIAAGLSPFSPDIVAVKAGKIMLEQIREHVGQRHDFAIETTLAGRTYVRLLRDLKKKGYGIHLFYLWVCDVDLAVKRIAERVRMGGHDVPIDVVRRRFERGLANLFNLYRPFIDSWMLFDNSADSPRWIAKGKADELIVSDARLFKVIQEGIGNEEGKK